MTLRKTMDALAKDLAAKAKDKDVPMAERIDAFKALTGYFNAVQKVTKKSSSDNDDPDDGFNFANGFSEDKNGQSAPVRTHRNA